VHQVWLAAIPLVSAWADRRGRERVLLVGSVDLITSAVTLFPLADTANTALVLLALVVTGVFMGLVYDPMVAVFDELFSSEVRYSCASLGYQLGSIAGGGIAPAIAAALFAAWGSTAPSRSTSAPSRC
jgi:MFS family permease